MDNINKLLNASVLNTKETDAYLDMESHIYTDDVAVVLESGAVPAVSAVYSAVSLFVADVVRFLHLVVYPLHTLPSQPAREEPNQHLREKISYR